MLEDVILKKTFAKSMLQMSSCCVHTTHEIRRNKATAALHRRAQPKFSGYLTVLAHAKVMNRRAQ